LKYRIRNSKSESNSSKPSKEAGTSQPETTQGDTPGSFKGYPSYDGWLAENAHPTFFLNKHA